MDEVLIGIGSNLEPEQALRAAVVALKQRFGRVVCSSVYLGPAAGLAAAHYMNMVVQVVTDAEVDPLRADLAAIETATGAHATTRASAGSISICWRTAGASTLQQRLPRPGLYSLPFVLVPLAEIAPQFAHPLTGERCSAALAAARRSPDLRILGELATLGA